MRTSSISQNSEEHEKSGQIRVYSRNSWAKLFWFDYGARKYPEMSMTTCVGFDPKMLMEPFAAGTIAKLDVIVPSMAFRVETNG